MATTEEGGGAGVGGGGSPGGRLHSLWSSLFSRFVGVLGQINTSNQPSEMASRPIVPQHHQPRGIFSLILLMGFSWCRLNLLLMGFLCLA